MKTLGRILLILVAVGCFAVALSYPILYHQQEESTESNLERLVALRDAGRASSADANTDTEANPGAEPPEQAQVAALDQDAETPADDQQAASDEFSEESQINNPAADDADAAGLDDASGSSKPDLAASDSAEEAVSVSDGNTSGEAASKPVAAVANEAAVDGAEEPASEPAAPAEIAAEADDAVVSASEPVVEAVNDASGNAEDGASAPAVATANEVESANAEDAASELAAVAANDVAAIASDPEAEGTAHPVYVTPEPTPTPVPTPSPTPAPTVNRWERTGALSYNQKEKVTLDLDKILPEYREIYNLNNDFVGWITIPGVDVDYPIVQSEDSEFYLHHDFFGESNNNGQIILDTKCDPYTPSYNLVISGHNMRSGKMFGELVSYASESFWKEHKYVYFDTLMERKQYVIFAAFYSADYDVNEDGFRYNADIQYAMDLKQWKSEIEANRVYDTGIDIEFGDEFLTLTTCNKSRRNDGRFVVVCRKLRDNETA